MYLFKRKVRKVRKQGEDLEGDPQEAQDHNFEVERGRMSDSERKSKEDEVRNILGED